MGAGSYSSSAAVDLNRRWFLMLTDLVSRTIISPTILPIGVITALIGAPAFAFILMKQRNGMRGGL